MRRNVLGLLMAAFVLAAVTPSEARKKLRIGVLLDGPSARTGEVLKRIKAEVISLTEGEFDVTFPDDLVLTGDYTHRGIAALAGQSFDAEMTEVGVTSEAMGATYPVIATILKPSAKIRAGMAAELAFELAGDKVAGSFSVPPSAVGEDRQGRYVWVAQKSGEGLAVVKRRAVKVGELSSGGLELSSGLKAGDLLITAGVSKIRDGLKVKLMAKKSK